MNVRKEVADIINRAVKIACDRKYEYITPELLLCSMCEEPIFAESFRNCGGNILALKNNLEKYLEQYMDFMDTAEPKISVGMGEVLSVAELTARSSQRNVVDILHIVRAMWNLKDSFAVYYMECQNVELVDLLQALARSYERQGFPDGIGDGMRERAGGGIGDGMRGRAGGGIGDGMKGRAGGGIGDGMRGKASDGETDDSVGDLDRASAFLRMEYGFVTCLNDSLQNENPLIGREKELERTIQILCRKDKNNPLHIGEPGTGKTAITYGLVRRIIEEKVPKELIGAKVFAMDMGNMLAGTKYRGDFEKRMKQTFEMIQTEEKPIVYIDEIHNIVGAGSVGGAMDAANILKPYLADGHIRFIGATTFEEYKKYVEKNKSIVRRFQNVEIKEPGYDETVKILRGLKKKYEEFHGVKYRTDVLEYVVEMSKKHIHERYLPDKAIDLIDEAGAYRKLHPLPQKQQTVGKDVINTILSDICKVNVKEVTKEEGRDYRTLDKRIRSNVFGQDEAISQVVNAVKFAKAGLHEDGKPLTSLLFVGPTGVGKTEIARCLAKELGVELIRFDMSEYGEKHALAKFIGSPAGYVGYEDGGLLTEAIRKNPTAVLLLDEIEKAHTDIYNVLLQVMDYATLTDNQGRKADFRNVIIIMTSNAGASQIGKPGIGFGTSEMNTGAIMDEVKRIFQPEFRNRLNQIVVFHHMEDTVSKKIVIKKLNQLGQMLQKRKVSFTFTENAVEQVKKMGISREFGAREIDRVIENEVKPLLVDELLFGKLRKGGVCKLDVCENELKMYVEEVC